MRNLIDSLESRRHYSLSNPFLTHAPSNSPLTPGKELTTVSVPLAPQNAISAAVKASRLPIATREDEYNLSIAQVNQLLAQAGSQMRDGQAAVIVDREGIVLGVYATTGATQATIDAATTRARTGAYFESTQDAFTTRTARFIIQDHFPFPIRNTPGGPLYGVQFSSLPGTDILSAAQTPGVSGDPGGLPLFIDKAPAGGIGVAGDGSDVAARDTLASPGQKVYTGKEEADFDESVAMAAVSGAAASKAIRVDARAPAGIQATKIFLPGPGLRFPYTASKMAKGQPFLALDQLTAAGKGTVSGTVAASLANPFPKVAGSVYGIPGEYKNTTVPGYGIVASDDVSPTTGALLSEGQRLTVSDVDTLIRQAVQTALNVRAAIRLPIGTPAIVHITIVDRDGTLLGAFKMNDGTNFSFDVAVQKARTVAFFSDDTHAFTARAIGFMSQKYFPAGIDGGATGPLYQLQDALSDNQGSGPLANGITTFPGGVPLYKNGVLVGGIGVSGDGVEQDDQIAYGGAKGFQAPVSIRDDALGHDDIRDFITAKVAQIETLYDLTTNVQGQTTGVDFSDQAFQRLGKPFRDFTLPYVKFARNSLIKD